LFLSEGKSESNGLSLLLMTEPGSQHGLGAFMLSEFFRHAGWRVMLVTPQDMTDFKRVFLSDWFDVVVLSMSTDRQIDKVSKAVSELRSATANPHLKIFLGGAMANISPERLNWPGTTLLFTDAAQTVERITQAVDKSSLHTQASPLYRSHTNHLELPKASKM
jgi:methylmalonyl-CoA mutase cobalamin-binding subunit